MEHTCEHSGIAFQTNIVDRTKYNIMLDFLKRYSLKDYTEDSLKGQYESGSGLAGTALEVRKLLKEIGEF